jgi:hypothetical protein
MSIFNRNKKIENHSEAGFVTKDIYQELQVPLKPEVVQTEQEGSIKKEQVFDVEKKAQVIEKKPEKPLVTKVTTTAPVVVPLTPDEQREVKEIESILAEDLEEFYLKLDPETQRQFKIQGEDTARAINVLMHKTKVKIKEIVDLIIKWLKIIPGISKFFIEQEAKIKIDKIMNTKK